ncbi:MAG: BrnT family toxin [Nitrospirota bacterium]
MADAAVVYDFQWDPEKANTNRQKHKVTFEEAATVFLDPSALSLYDDEHSGAEDRWITLGFSSAGRLLVVCHTFHEHDRRQHRVRIVSSRKAAKKERQAYER